MFTFNEEEGKEEEEEGREKRKVLIDVVDVVTYDGNAKPFHFQIATPPDELFHHSLLCEPFHFNWQNSNSYNICILTHQRAVP